MSEHAKRARCRSGQVIREPVVVWPAGRRLRCVLPGCVGFTNTAWETRSIDTDAELGYLDVLRSIYE